MRAYAFLGEALKAYQSAVVEALRARGVDVEPLATGDLADVAAIADRETALLFLCGLPYVRLRDAGHDAQPLVAPVPVDAPEAPPGYRSALLARPGLGGASLDDLGDLKLAINHRESMSGWVLPVGHGLPLDRFAAIVETGSHRASLDLLLDEDADAAPIDSHLLAAEAMRDPRLADLPVLASYGPSPSPPVVLTRGSGDAAADLRDVLANLHRDADGAAALALGGMARLDPVDDAFYDPTRDCDRRAALCTR